MNITDPDLTAEDLNAICQETSEGKFPTLDQFITKMQGHLKEKQMAREFSLHLQESIARQALNKPIAEDSKLDLF